MRRATLELAAVAALAAVVATSGVWVVETKHRGRLLFVELEELNREQDRLQIDWGRLQLEQSTLATHPRIEALARDQLALAEPAEEQVVLILERAP